MSVGLVCAKQVIKIQISSQLMEQLAIPLSRQKTATKWLVMLRCGKNFLLTYNPYAARRNFFRALHLGEL
jgi:hypothetical protein